MSAVFPFYFLIHSETSQYHDNDNNDDQNIIECPTMKNKYLF
jgi:hypothetical protein